ncbi:MAG: glycoside hydrolase domain-containing protein, partial [Anaerolineae bacterium]
MNYAKLFRLLLWTLLVGCVVSVWFAPTAGAASPSYMSAAPPLPPRTEVFVGQGFDTCEVPSVAALEAWFVSSPYRVVNLYIGGAGRYCSNRALNADLVARLGQIGWRFIPTWVGPQAPCYAGRKPLMSEDPATAHAQGIAEAAAAIKVAADLGLASADGSGTIIYYDLEHYNSSDPACHEPVAAFISGWVAALRAAGNLAGVYGNPAPLVSFATLSTPPDAIW